MHFEALVGLLRALADPTRLRLLALCTTAPASVSALAAALQEPEPAVSRQLKALAEAGLLRRVRRGQRVEYSGVERGAAAGFVAQVLQQLPDDDVALDRARRSLSAVAARAGQRSRTGVGPEALEHRLGAALVSLLPDQIGVGGIALVTGAPPAELLRALATRHERLLVATDTVAARTRQRRRLAEADVAADVLLSGDVRTALLERPPALCCVDLRDCADWAAGAARLRWLQRLQDQTTLVLLLLDYDLVEASGTAGRAPLIDLRARLESIGFDTLRIHPVEADGRHRLFVHCATRRLDRLRAA